MALSGPMNRESPLRGFETRPDNGTAAKPGGNGTGSTTLSMAFTSFTRKYRLFAATAAPRPLPKQRQYSVPTSASLRLGVILAQIMRSVNALFAPLNSKPTNTQKSRHVRSLAGALQAQSRALVCLSVSEAGKTDVYCLTVPDTGNFVLANGAIVSNCADRDRYACMSRPISLVPKPQPQALHPLHAKHIFQPVGAVE
jgi:hypothetical protein